MHSGLQLLFVVCLFSLALAVVHNTRFLKPDDEFLPRSRVHQQTSAMPGEQPISDNPFCHDPDCGKNVTELITSKGYPCEDHTVVTEDGFVLSLQRIPHGINGSFVPGKPVVFLQHGLLDASHTWVINFPNESLGFILADAGYDVWMGNSRGNTYSIKSIYYTTNQSEFWAWSWDEMAKYDLPAMINYVLQQTHEKQLFYVGHSQGTMEAFAGFENDELASKVKLFVALAPVAYVGHITAWLFQMLAHLDVGTIVSLLGFNQFLPDMRFFQLLLPAICDADINICQWAACMSMGCDPSDWNMTRFDVYMQLDPAGTSVQNMIHYQQQVDKDNFCLFDFGYFDNEKIYGQHDAPCYNLTAVDVPVAIFSGGNDDLADPTDVAHLISQLNPEKIVYQEVIQPYSHLDFVWGMDAADILYPTIIQLFQQFE